MSGASLRCAARARQTPDATRRNVIPRYVLSEECPHRRAGSTGVKGNIVTTQEQPQLRRAVDSPLGGAGVDILSNEKSERYSSDKSSSEKSERYPVVHVQGGSAIRRPLIVLAVCAVAAIGYLARDFLIPTAGAVVLALILTPVANTFERLRLSATPAAAASVTLLALGLAGLLAISIPAVSNWIDQGPFLTYTMERN